MPRTTPSHRAARGVLRVGGRARPGCRSSVLQEISDLPEFKNGGIKNVDLTARFLDYTPEKKCLIVGEENVMANPKDPNTGDSHVIRVFANALYYVAGTRPVDPAWEKRGRDVQQYELRVQRLDVRFDGKLKELYEKAMSAGKWKGTAAAHDRVAYWVKGVLGYFDGNGLRRRLASNRSSRGGSNSGRGLPQSKGFARFDARNRAPAFWTAAALCRFHVGQSSDRIRLPATNRSSCRGSKRLRQVQRASGVFDCASQVVLRTSRSNR